MKRRIMVIGPNGVGKTKFAYELARKNNGEIINLDRTYLYKGFPIATGLYDTLKEKGVPRHLYEILEPQEESLSKECFSEVVSGKIEDIISRGKFAVAEGGSTVYVPNLLKNNYFDQVIGLRFPENYDFKSKYKSRIEQAFTDGLSEELRKNISLYENSFLIKECHFAVPTIRYLRGKISLAAAKEEILLRCTAYHDRQMKLFLQFPNINWVT